MAYKDPDQIERLVKRLYHPNFDFYIHVDKKFDLKPFLYLGDLPNVYFTTKRYYMIWASFRLIKALLVIMDELLKSDKKYDFISAFTGQDYPLKSPDEIYTFFSNNINHSFITIENQGADWYNRCELRYKNYHMTNYKFKGKYFIERLINKFLPERKLPHFNKIYGGPRASWWTLSAECSRYVIDFFNQHPDFTKFCKYTWAPDEFLIPTILMNSPLKDKIILDGERFIDWSLGGANPKVFTTDDFEKLKKSDKLFARKFDVKINVEILDKLDALQNSIAA